MFSSVYMCMCVHVCMHCNAFSGIHRDIQFMSGINMMHGFKFNFLCNFYVNGIVPMPGHAMPFE